MIFEVIPGHTGNYTNLWDLYLNQPLDLATAASDVQGQIVAVIRGLFEIAIAPIAQIASDVSVVKPAVVTIDGTVVNLHLIFLAVLLVFTVINPLNIIYTFIMNAKMLRFITVFESSDVYKYRQ